MPFISPWSRVLCPICFNRFHMGQSPFRCINPDATMCPYEPDLEWGRFLGRKRSVRGVEEFEPVPMRRILPESARSLSRWIYTPHEVRCSTCRVPTRARICPECHNRLPPNLSEIKNRIVAVIGARAAGKSNFIAVLIKALRERYAHGLSFVMWEHGQETLDKYERVYFNPLFRDHSVVPPTSTAATNEDIRIPLIYRLQFAARGMRQVRSIYLVLFDAAGEDMGDQQMWQTHLRYIRNAAGIIFLVNPLDYDTVRDKLPSGLPAGMFSTSRGKPHDSVVNVMNMFDRSAHSKIKVPVVFAFTKSDMLRHIVPDARFLKDSVHDGAFNRTDYAAVDDEIQACIHDWDGPAFLDLVRGSFSNYSFSAVSAFGDAPRFDPVTNALRINALAPIRVADPLLWLLKQEGHIR